MLTAELEERYFVAYPFYLDRDNIYTTLFPSRPLEEFDSHDARKAFATLVSNKDVEVDYHTLPEMQLILEIIENAEDYEIVECLEGEESVTARTLGFDVGWTNNYSVIADTAFTPMWHGPDYDDMKGIVEQLWKLNENGLFPLSQNVSEDR